MIKEGNVARGEENPHHAPQSTTHVDKKLSQSIKKSRFKFSPEVQRQHFIAKNKMLEKSGLYRPMQATVFLEEIFKGRKILYHINQDKIAKRGKTSLENFPYELMPRNDFFVYYNEYFQDWANSKLLKTVRVLVVDIDGYATSKNSNQIFLNEGITPNNFWYLINKVIKRINCPPHYIVNSGRGVHLIYLIEPLEYYNAVKDFVNEVNKRLQLRFNSQIEEGKLPKVKVDVHEITQAYRVPGSATKIGNLASVYKLVWSVKRPFEPYDIDKLAKWLKVSNKKIEEFIKFQEKIKQQANSLQKTETQRKPKNKKGNLLHIPNGGRTFFEWYTAEEQYETVKPGRRYYYLFFLFVVAYKCKKVSYNEAYEKAQEIMKYFNERDGGNSIKEEELEKAKLGYNNKAVKVRREVIMNKTGIKMIGNKRNGRTRAEHLYLARKIIEGKKELNEMKIKELLEQGYNKTEIAKKLNMTVRNLNITYRHLFRKKK